MAAAPLLFDLFALLPPGDGFDPPYDLMERMAVCRQSGHRASQECTTVDSLWTLKQAIRTPLCPYHISILVDRDSRLRTRPGGNAERISWFSLPPAMEQYYMAMDLTYRPLPAWEPGSESDDEPDVMELIYPDAGSRILVPVLLDGKHAQVVLQAAHRDKSTRLHWDLDGTHRGTTLGDHKLTVDIEAGRHTLTLTDDLGRNLQANFSVDRGTTGKP